MTDVKLEFRVMDHELTITYRGRTWDLTAYPLEDFGTWEVIVHEQGTATPAMPAAEWGVIETLRSPWEALSIVTGAILHQVWLDHLMNAKLIGEEDRAGNFSEPDFEADDSQG